MRPLECPVEVLREGLGSPLPSFIVITYYVYCKHSLYDYGIFFIFAHFFTFFSSLIGHKITKATMINVIFLFKKSDMMNFLRDYTSVHI